MINKFKSLSPLVQFLIKFGAILLLWELTYSFWIEKNGALDAYLTDLVSDVSIQLLNLSNYESYSVKLMDGSQEIIYEGKRLLRIAHPCNGLILQVLFISFLLSFKGDALLKLITVIFGTIGIFLINVLRVYSLVLVQIYAPEYLDFSHKYLFTAVVYGFVLCIWLLWVNKFADVKLLQKQP